VGAVTEELVVGLLLTVVNLTEMVKSLTLSVVVVVVVLLLILPVEEGLELSDLSPIQRWSLMLPYDP
jgi:hypothetical protein